MEKRKCAVDRIETDGEGRKIAVLIDDITEAEYTLTDSGLLAGEVVTLTLEGGHAVSAEVIPNEGEERSKSNRSRLSALFGRGKDGKK